MKQIILKTCILILPFWLMVSCNTDDFLDQKNPNEISEATYWRNLAETGTGLNAVYQTLQHPAVINKIREIFFNLC